MNKPYLWVEQYAPATVAECILPDAIRAAFGTYAVDKEFPNLILAGPAGVGKTSVARALCSEIDADLLFVNASLDRGIGEVRTTVAQFASCSSLTGGKKVVLLDEADNLTQDSQKALRALIEEFQFNCRFILTCNYPHNIIDAIHSRCTTFDFHIRGTKVREKLVAKFCMRCVEILREHEVQCEPKLLHRLVTFLAPDWRRVLNTLQGKSTAGRISEDILEETPDAVVTALSEKKWEVVRDWVFEHAYLHPRQIERMFWDTLIDRVDNTSKPLITLIFAEYSAQIGYGADPCITLLAMLTRIMMEANFK